LEDFSSKEEKFEQWRYKKDADLQKSASFLLVIF